MRSASLTSRAYPVFDPRPANLARAVGVAAATVACACASLAVGDAIDALTAGEDVGARLVAVLALAALATAAAVLLGAWVPRWAGVSRAMDAAASAARQLLAAPSRAFARHDKGYYVNVLTGSTEVYGTMCADLNVSVLGSGLALAALVAIAAAQDVLLAAMLLAYVPAFALALRLPARRLARLRKPPHAQAHVHHDDDEAEALQHGAGARVRVGDGRQVAHLGQKHAQQGERRDAPERAHVAQSGQQVARLPHAAHHEEDDRGQQQAHAGDPGNGNAETAGHELGARAREAPADAARKRAYDAAHNMTVPRRRFRHLNRTLFPHALSAVCKAGIVARPADAVKGVSRDRRKTPASGRKDPSACAPYSRPSSSIFFTKAPV